ncbi:MAG: class II aldolase/adducin family protein, partial [Eubacteriales bacterium]
AYHKMESVEFYAELLYKSKMLGGPKEFDKEQIAKLYEIRRQMGLPGKHPADLCQNNGTLNCHNCGGCSITSSNPTTASADVVAEVTKQVMKQLGL